MQSPQKHLYIYVDRNTGIHQGYPVNNATDQYGNYFFRQICESSTPLHPVLPGLIEVFVNSALIPASNRGSSEAVNEPISEHEIRAIFQKPVFELPARTGGQSPIRPGVPARAGRSRESTPFSRTASPMAGAPAEVTSTFITQPPY